VTKLSRYEFLDIDVLITTALKLRQEGVRFVAQPHPDNHSKPDDEHRWRLILVDELQTCEED
jgi:hypothetical protein